MAPLSVLDTCDCTATWAKVFGRYLRARASDIGGTRLRRGRGVRERAPTAAGISPPWAPLASGGVVPSRCPPPSPPGANAPHTPRCDVPCSPEARACPPPPGPPRHRASGRRRDRRLRLTDADACARERGQFLIASLHRTMRVHGTEPAHRGARAARPAARGLAAARRRRAGRRGRRRSGERARAHVDRALRHAHAEVLHSADHEEQREFLTQLQRPCSSCTSRSSRAGTGWPRP
jgi:hypothetical protein